ncbi:tRNA (adenine(58)-N(1))-methyltransferase non-catalytic subunit trm6, partial [Tulasnella sp. 403]
EDFRSIQITEKPTRIHLGKFGSFAGKHLIGHPFGLSYEILGDASIKARQPDTMVDLEDTSATNELINDGKFVQPLTFDEIETLKRTPGVHSSDIIKLQIAQNANYELKTEYSKEKYKKRKEAKFLQGFAVLEPTMFNICEYWFAKDPQRIRGIRSETLAQMMSFANIRPGSRILVVDDAGGLLVASCLDRLGGEGRVFAILDNDAPPPFHIVDQLNLDPDEINGVFSTLNWAEVEEDYTPIEQVEPTAPTSQNNRHRRLKRQTRAEELRSRREELWAGEWDALLIATEYEPFAVSEKLFPYLGGSAGIIIHSPYVQILANVHQKMRTRREYLSPSITEAWHRQYQVLPGRTHPMMNTSGSGGYLLSVTKVYDDATANSVNARRRNDKTPKPSTDTESTDTPGEPIKTDNPVGESTVERTINDDLMDDAIVSD